MIWFYEFVPLNSLDFLTLQILLKYPTWRISYIILNENFFSSFSHFKFLKSLSQLKNKSVKESMKNQNGALYKKKKKSKNIFWQDNFSLLKVSV